MSDLDVIQTLLDDHPWYKLPRWRQWLIAIKHCNPWSAMFLLDKFHRLQRLRWRCMMDHEQGEIRD